MKLYSIEIQIAATAYIKAESAEAAMKIAEDLKDDFLELNEQEDAGIAISGLGYDDPGLPELSLSPAMTILGTLGEPSEVET